MDPSAQAVSSRNEKGSGGSLKHDGLVEPDGGLSSSLLKGVGAIGGGPYTRRDRRTTSLPHSGEPDRRDKTPRFTGYPLGS